MVSLNHGLGLGQNVLKQATESRTAKQVELNTVIILSRLPLLNRSSVSIKQATSLKANRNSPAVEVLIKQEQ